MLAGGLDSEGLELPDLVSVPPRDIQPRLGTDRAASGQTAPPNAGR